MKMGMKEELRRDETSGQEKGTYYNILPGFIFISSMYFFCSVCTTYRFFFGRRMAGS